MKTYIKPEIEIYNVEVEQPLLSASEPGQIGEGYDEGGDDNEFIYYNDEYAVYDDIWK